MAGDEAAFESIVREHQGMVYSIGWHFLRDRALAEEMAQDVFLHLYRNLNSMESARHLTHWLRKVATHRCIDQARRRKLASWPDVRPGQEPVAQESRRDPMLAGLLARMVATLPPKPRMMVILRYQEDMEPAEIAELLEVPVGTVKSGLHRALALLRSKMRKETAT